MMTNARKQILFVSFAVAGVVATGCSKSAPPNPSPGFDDKKFVGTWMEERDPSQGSYNTIDPENQDDKHRLLEVNDDGTFKLSFVDEDGNPMMEDKYVSGTWEQKGKRVTFNVTDNQFTAELSDDIPNQITRVNLQGDSAAQKVDQIRVTRGESGYCWYSRKP